MPSSANPILQYIGQFRVEPVIFLGFVAMTFSQNLQQVGMYQVMCHKIYAVSHPEIDCHHLADVLVEGNVTAENAVQKAMSTWSLANGLSYVLPALISDVFWGAYGDRYGRKVNMLLGMAGFMVSTFSFVAIFVYPLVVPLYALIIVNVVAGFTGYLTICMISAGAYLADTILEPHALTVRLALMTLFMGLGTIFGPMIAGATNGVLTQAQGLVVSMGILFLAFVLCLVLVEQVPPREMRRRLLAAELAAAKDEKASIDSPPAPETTRKEVEEATTVVVAPKESVCLLAFNLVRETWYTYVRPRPGHGRAYLFCAAGVFFLYYMTTTGLSQIVTLYLQKAPLSWNQGTIGYYGSVQAAMIAVGTTIGMVVFKKWLRMADTFVMIIACASLLGELVIMSFATLTWLVYFSAVVNCMSALILPVTQSFLSKQVNHDEVGKAFTAFGMSASVAVMVSQVVCSQIYSATLTVYPGFVFLFAAILVLVAFAVILWVHYDLYLSHRSLGFGKALLGSVFGRGLVEQPPQSKLTEDGVGAVGVAGVGPSVIGVIPPVVGVVSPVDDTVASETSDVGL